MPPPPSPHTVSFGLLGTSLYGQGLMPAVVLVSVCDRPVAHSQLRHLTQITRDIPLCSALYFLTLSPCLPSHVTVIPGETRDCVSECCWFVLLPRHTKMLSTVAKVL